MRGDQADYPVPKYALPGGPEPLLDALWKVAVVAFIAMCLQDALGTVMVIAESKGGIQHALIAGGCDSGAWLVGLFTTFLGIESILKKGIRDVRSLTIVASITLANFLGTVLAVSVANG